MPAFSNNHYSNMDQNEFFDRAYFLESVDEFDPIRDAGFSYHDAFRVALGRLDLNDSVVDEIIDEALANIPEEFQENWLKNIYRAVRPHLKTIGSAAGTAIGGAVGGPAGAAIGGSLGGALGGIVQNIGGGTAGQRRPQPRPRPSPRIPPLATPPYVPPQTRPLQQNPRPSAPNATPAANQLLQLLNHPAIRNLLQGLASGRQIRAGVPVEEYAENLTRIGQLAISLGETLQGETSTLSQDDITALSESLLAFEGAI